ncbi:unnamed protein product [Protopolystoma xenopodis]|uniref:Uncharacterized protein n=1 Tax=Protopolystoma xenopodis TaxID=117903 RepID=A0A448XM02_9PLAT|nr:unnamed protein product [Protopolystoma xenopodis]
MLMLLFLLRRHGIGSPRLPSKRTNLQLLSGMHFTVVSDGQLHISGIICDEYGPKSNANHGNSSPVLSTGEQSTSANNHTLDITDACAATFRAMIHRQATT